MFLSPEDIRSRSCGEVTEIDLIDFRAGTFKDGGLFCERIFGPTTDEVCRCGEMAGTAHRGERCGVEVTDSGVRGERIGHIALAVPVQARWTAETTPFLVDIIPVSPPDDRPFVRYPDGRTRYHGVNDLYRRVINRNNRLKKLSEVHTPEHILDREKRLLQEAVDALMDGLRRSRTAVGTDLRVLRTVTEILEGSRGVEQARRDDNSDGGRTPQ